MLTFFLERVGFCFLLGCWALRLMSMVFGESFSDMWMESLCICVLLFEHLRHLGHVESCRHCAGVLLMCWLLVYNYPSFFAEPIPSENRFHPFLLHVFVLSLIRLHGVHQHISLADVDLFMMLWVLLYVCTLMGLHRLNVLQHVAVAFAVMTSEPWKEDTAVIFLLFDLGGVRTMQICLLGSARSWLLPMTAAVFYCAGKAGLWIYCAGLCELENIGLWNAMKWLCNAGHWFYRAGKAAVERAAAERAERADVQRKAAEKEAAKMAAADKAAAKKAAAEKAAVEMRAAEKTATVKAAVAIKAAADKASAVKAAAEKAAAVKAAAEKAAAVRAAAEKAAAVRAAAEKAAAIKAAAEKAAAVEAAAKIAATEEAGAAKVAAEKAAAEKVAERMAVRAAVERVMAELAMVENAGAEQWAAVQSVATQRAEEKEEKAAEEAQREPRGSPDARLKVDARESPERAQREPANNAPAAVAAAATVVAAAAVLPAVDSGTWSAGPHDSRGGRGGRSGRGGRGGRGSRGCGAAMAAAASPAITCNHLQSPAITAATPAAGESADAPPANNFDESTCVICMELPRNAMIVHEDTGHFCCCLACALREQQRGQPCPICRQPIEKVIRSFAS